MHIKEHRESRVREVLSGANEPLGPTEIGRRIGEPWCCSGGYGMSAPITPICRRIGATRVGNGKYVLESK